MENVILQTGASVYYFAPSLLAPMSPSCIHTHENSSIVDLLSCTDGDGNSIIPTAHNYISPAVHFQCYVYITSSLSSCHQHCIISQTITSVLYHYHDHYLCSCYSSHRTISYHLHFISILHRYFVSHISSVLFNISSPLSLIYSPAMLHYQ